MGIYSNLNQVNRLTNSSLGAIVENTNLNFVALTSAFQGFLANLQYNETLNNVTLNAVTAASLNLTSTFTMLQNGSITLTIDSQGRIVGTSFTSQIIQTKRLRFTEFPDRPASDTIGEIVYTGPNASPLPEGLFLYTQYGGWVRLDGGGSGGSQYLDQLLDVNTTHSPGLQNGDILTFDSTINKWVDGQRYINVTYDALVAQMAANKLIPFMYYVIIDYQTSGYFFNTDNYFNSNIEPIVVQAISNNQISDEAYSLTNPTDEILYSVEIPTLNYLSLLDVSFYGKTVATAVPNFKGFISYRRDPVNNIEGYLDWRNWQYRLYKLNYPAWADAAYNPGDIVKYNVADAQGNTFFWMALNTITSGSGITPGSNSTRWMVFSLDEYLCVFPEGLGTQTITAANSPTITYSIVINTSDYKIVNAIQIEDDPTNISQLKNITFERLNTAYVLSLLGDSTFVTIIPQVVLRSIGPVFWDNIIVGGIGTILSTSLADVSIKVMLFSVFQTYPCTEFSGFSYTDCDFFIGSWITAPSISKLEMGAYCYTVLIGAYVDANDGGFNEIIFPSGMTNALISLSDTSSKGKISGGNIDSIMLIDCNHIRLGDDCSGTFMKSSNHIILGDSCYNLSFPVNSFNLEVKPGVNSQNLIASHSIPGTVMDKVIFKTSAGNTRMSYFDGSDSLVVLDPTI